MCVAATATFPGPTSMEPMVQYTFMEAFRKVEFVYSCDFMKEPKIEFDVFGLS